MRWRLVLLCPGSTTAATVLPDEIGFVLEFVVGMRFPTLTIVSVA